MMIGKRDYVKIINNHRLKFLKKHKVQPADYETQNEVISGCGDTDYLFLIDYVLTNTPKCIVEYGTGYSTWLINELIHDYKLDIYLISHEDDKTFFRWALQNLHIPREVIHFTPCSAVPERSTGKYKVGKYNDNYEGYPDVDFIITDGPGPTPAGDFNVTDNYRLIREYQDRKIPHWIDGRGITKDYYIELGYGEEIVHY